MSKSLAMIALAFGVLAISAGSAFADSGCGYSHGTQSVSVETQTASTDATVPYTPKPEGTSN